GIELEVEDFAETQQAVRRARAEGRHQCGPRGALRTRRRHQAMGREMQDAIVRQMCVAEQGGVAETRARQYIRARAAHERTGELEFIRIDRFLPGGKRPVAAIRVRSGWQGLWNSVA